MKTTVKTIDLKVTPRQKMVYYGATGRISDIIGEHGYNKLIDKLAMEDEKSLKALKTLRDFVGWGIEYLESK